MLIAYSRGVNDYLAQARRTGDWPSLFGLTGVYRGSWTPIDSLVVQGELTQELDYTTTPLDYAMLSAALGLAHTMAWFPILPPGRQTPYDPGPYHYRGVAPLAGALAGPKVSPAPGRAAAHHGHSAQQQHSSTSRRPLPRGACQPSSSRLGGAGARSRLAALGRSTLPAGELHGYPDSNAWAANGPKVLGAEAHAGRRPAPAADPALDLVPGRAVGTGPVDVTGVSVPGLPGVLIGHNAHIAWSLTDTQNQATLFYAEQTSKARPGQYFWRGAGGGCGRCTTRSRSAAGRPRQLTVDRPCTAR